LRDEEISDKYQESIETNLKMTLITDDVNVDWENTKNCATEILGENKAKIDAGWFDDDCRQALFEKNEAKKKCLQRETRQNYETYKEKRKTATKLCREKKRLMLKRILQDMECQRRNNDPRKFYKILRNLTKSYQPRLNSCKDSEGQMLIEKKDIMERWKDEKVISQHF
jgi:hypothetical protein